MILRKMEGLLRDPVESEPAFCNYYKFTFQIQKKKKVQSFFISSKSWGFFHISYITLPEIQWWYVCFL